MPDVFSQLHIHLVFAVKHRQSLIHPIWEDKLFSYITGIVQKRGHKLLAIGGMPDHIHIFIGMKPVGSISDLVMEIKKASNKFIAENGFCPYPFSWQNGYGVFSYHKNQMKKICNYVLTQKEHHREHTFREEYLQYLKEFEIEIGKKELFDFLE